MSVEMLATELLIQKEISQFSNLQKQNYYPHNEFNSKKMTPIK